MDQRHCNWTDILWIPLHYAIQDYDSAGYGEPEHQRKLFELLSVKLDCTQISVKLTVRRVDASQWREVIVVAQ